MNTADCGISITCFKLPPKCSNSADCEVLVKIKYDANANDTVNVAISTKDGYKYAGWAQTDKVNSEKMVKIIVLSLQ